MSNLSHFKRYGLMLMAAALMGVVSHSSFVRPIEAQGMNPVVYSNNVIDSSHNNVVATVVGAGFAYSSGQFSELGLAAPRGPKPILQVNPTSLTFNAIKDGSNPVSQFFTISSGNTVPIDNWTVTENINWLTVDASTGTNERNINVVVVISGLNVGTYNGQITVKATHATDSPQVINVTLNVAAPTATATNTPTATATNTPTTPPTNTPTTPPTNTPTTPPTNTPTTPPTNTPTTPPTNTPTTPPTNTPAIPPTNTPAIPPTNTPAIPPTNTPATQPTNTPATQPTNTPTIQPTNNPMVSILQVNPTNLIFYATQGSTTNPGSQPFAISNGSSGSLNWTVNENKSWLSVDTLSGSNGDVVNVLLDVNGLIIGTYNGQITVIATGATNSPMVVNVTLNVSEFDSTATNTPTLQSTDMPTLTPVSTPMPTLTPVSTPMLTTTPIIKDLIYLPVLIKSKLLPTPTPTLTPASPPTPTPASTPTPTPTLIDLYVETKNTGGVNLKMYDKESNELLLSCDLPAEPQLNVFNKSYCGKFLKKGQLYKFEAKTNKCGVFLFEVHINQITEDNTIQTWCN